MPSKNKKRWSLKQCKNRLRHYKADCPTLTDVEKINNWIGGVEMGFPEMRHLLPDARRQLAKAMMLQTNRIFERMAMVN